MRSGQRGPFSGQMTHDKNTCPLCEGRDWFPPILAKEIDEDLIAYGTEAHIMQDALVQLHFARTLTKLVREKRKENTP